MATYTLRQLLTHTSFKACAKFLQSKFIALNNAGCMASFKIFRSLAFELIKNFNKCGKKSSLFFTKYKDFLDKKIEYKPMYVCMYVCVCVCVFQLYLFVTVNRVFSRMYNY